ncbi:MAG: universal stress protein [Anaerolineales bacterium]|nr:universal stress protein [Anaerolineales bacterium]
MSEANRTDIQILVALDGSADSLFALRSALALAVALEGKLVGLFVEDLNLIRLAALPFARELHLTTARFRPLSGPMIQGDIRMQASRMQRIFRAEVVAAGVPGEWRIVRGFVPDAVLTAAHEADLLVLGRSGQPALRRISLGSTARAAVLEATRSIFLARQAPASPHRLIVTFDHTARSWHALRLAAALAGGGEILLLLLTDSGDEAAAWQRQLENWLARQELTAAYRQLAPLTLTRLLNLIQQEHCEILVIGNERLPVPPEIAVNLLAQIDCSLLLVRS